MIVCLQQQQKETGRVTHFSQPSHEYLNKKKQKKKTLDFTGCFIQTAKM